MKKPTTAYRLQVTISALFLLLIVPLYSGLIWYTYRSNVELAQKNAEESMLRVKAETTAAIVNFMAPIANSVRSAAQLGSIQPDFFRKEASGQYLLRSIQNHPAVKSYYIGFGDGSFRQVLAVAPAVPIFKQLAPPEARYGNRMIDRSRGQDTVDTYTFLKDWNQPVGTRSAKAEYDPREREFYREGVKRGVDSGPNEIFVSDPFISLSTQKQEISISSSIVSNKKFVGVAAASLTLRQMSAYLSEHRISPGSLTFILDGNGRVIAAPESQMAETTAATPPRKLSELGNPVLTAAYTERVAGRADKFKYLVGGEEYIALFAPFPATFYKPAWQVVVIAPLNDFIGDLKILTRRIALLGAGLLLLAIVLTYLVSKRLSRPLERLVQEIRQILDFQVSPDLVIASRVTEIRLLVDATQKLKTAVSAFAAYVPRQLVRDMIHSGMPIAPGGQSRYLTMLFTDLQGFSSLAEVTPTRELLRMVSAYLELVTYAVKEENGTIDKFIGDAVMAFWGAPALSEDHAFRACAAAVRAQRRMATLNAGLVDGGAAALTVRIGIHTDAVLVGNIGSMERLSYTVMGDGVNIASRLEGINKEFGTGICVSHTVFKEAGERLWLRPIDSVSVKGRRGEFLIYELLGIRDGDAEVAATARERALCALTTQAYALYAQGSHEQAARAYAHIAASYDDALAGVMAGRCKGNARLSPPPPPG